MAWDGYGGQCACPQLIGVLALPSTNNAPVVQLGEWKWATLHNQHTDGGGDVKVNEAKRWRCEIREIIVQSILKKRQSLFHFMYDSILKNR